LGLSFACAIALASTVSAEAEDLLFEVINDTSVGLVKLYISPGNVDNWEADVLGGEVLLSGQAIDVVITDGRSDCLYDLRGVFADGEEVEGHDVHLCETGAFTFIEQ
jgi:hypothetical protein